MKKQHNNYKLSYDETMIMIRKRLRELNKRIENNRHIRMTTLRNEFDELKSLAESHI